VIPRLLSPFNGSRMGSVEQLDVAIDVGRMSHGNSTYNNAGVKQHRGQLQP
jgi:hypothetical protein